jgi:putative permease
MVPLVGAVSAAIAGALVALLQWGTLSGLVKVLVIATGIRLIDDWFLHPMILRKAVHIHPALTVFSLMAGGTLFGFWGLLFAVPVVCFVKVLLGVLWEWYRSEYGLQTRNPAAEVSHIPLI